MTKILIVGVLIFAAVAVGVIIWVLNQDFN